MSAIDRIQSELDLVGRELLRGNSVYHIQRENVGKVAGLRFALEAMKRELPFSVRSDGQLEFNVESERR